MNKEGNVQLTEKLAHKLNWFNGIRARLFITLSSILALIGVCALMGFLHLSHERDLADLHLRGEVLARVQASALRFPLWNLNIDQVESLINMLKNADDFDGAQIIDPQDKVVVKIGENFDPNADFKFTKNILHDETGTEHNLGRIEIYLSTKTLKEQFKTDLINGIIALIILIFITFIAFWISLSQLVISPLRKMMAVIDHVAKGDFEKKLHIDRKDEFGSLATVFNRMTSEVSEMYRVIEQKVDTRTAELTVTNKALKHAQEKATKVAEMLQVEKEKSERLLVDALEISPAAMVLLDENYQILRWNQNLVRLAPEQLKGRLIVGADFQPLFNLIVGEAKCKRNYFVKGAEDIFDVEQPLANGRWLRMNQHITRDNFKALMLIDITDMKERERLLEQVNKEMAGQAERLRQSEQKYALAAHGANDGLWDYNIIEQSLYCSPRFKEMLGYEEHEIEFTSLDTWHSLIHADDVKDFKRAFEAHLHGKTPRFKIEYRILHKGGNYHWMLCRGLVARDSDDIPTRIAGSQTDITTQKNYEQELVHTAFHDPLTGLPNREYFMRELKECLEGHKINHDLTSAVLFIDLDRFKVVNDSLGHDIGDKLLIGISQRIKKCTRGRDTAARLGGDEFTVLLRDIPDEAEAEAVASRILDELRSPFNINGHEVFASASIGITMLTDNIQDVDNLIRNADLAMYRAKTMGKSRFEMFDQEMHTQIMDEMKVETDLRRAIEKNEISLHYQPIVDVVSNELIGFEGLMRWHYKHEEMMNIGKFMPIAEDTGLILPIGEHVLNIACMQLKEWIELIGPESKISIAINLSTCQIRDAAYMHRFQQKIQDYALPPGALKIEITESALMEDLDQVKSILTNFKKLGCPLCIDDFGTGYSSFSYLHKFPFDVLKIDQSFIQRMHESERMTNMVRGIINLSHDMGLLVVGEGIETEEQALTLKKLRCDFGQGYLFAKPMPPEAAEDFIKHSRLQRTEHSLMQNLMAHPPQLPDMDLDAKEA